MGDQSGLFGTVARPGSGCNGVRVGSCFCSCSCHGATSSWILNLKAPVSALAQATLSIRRPAIVILYLGLARNKSNLLRSVMKTEHGRRRRFSWQLRPCDLLIRHLYNMYSNSLPFSKWPRIMCKSYIQFCCRQGVFYPARVPPFSMQAHTTCTLS